LGRPSSKEESSFSEEKEAKRLLFVRPWKRPLLRGEERALKRTKVFWFFFSKKNRLLA
jgi:hypothetical protein